MHSFVPWLFTTCSVMLSVALAQTYTDCDPLNSTCAADVGLQSYTFATDFTTGENTSWTPANYTTITYSDLGAAFTINTEGEAPTISTDFYFLFGYIEVKMRAANGTGIVSSIVLESDDLDEIDWEWLGGNNTSVETNYFGKGNTTAYDRAIYYPVTTPTETFHTYALNWTSAALTWSIDGVAVRTLEYASALNGENYPQTPCRVHLGIWAGGASSSEGTVTWAGGETDFDDAPFTMYVESVKIINYNPAEKYNWTDHTGSFGSIEAINGTSSSSVSNSASNSSSSSTTTNAASSGVASSSITATGTSTASALAASSTVFAQGTNAAHRDITTGWTGYAVICLAWLITFALTSDLL